MHFLLGLEGLPAFQTRRLAGALGDVVGRRVSLGIREFFLLDAEEPDEQARTRLNRLLHAEPMPPAGPGDSIILVVPRRGTRSAWSSKAGDILKRCGFEHAARVERGLRIELDGVTAEELASSSREVLHDRMTETVQNFITKISNRF